MQQPVQMGPPAGMPMIMTPNDSTMMGIPA